MGYQENLRRLCAMGGLTHQQLGERAGLSKNTISRILSGKQAPKLPEAFDLARALGVTLDFLVSETPPTEPTTRLVEVTEDELTLLKTARILGLDVALKRILNVSAHPAEAEVRPAPPPESRRTPRTER